MTTDFLNFLDLWASQNILTMLFVSSSNHLHHYLKCLHMAMEAITNLTRLQDLRVGGHEKFKTNTYYSFSLEMGRGTPHYLNAGIVSLGYMFVCISGYWCLNIIFLFFLLKNMINNVKIRLKIKLKFPIFHSDIN